MNMLRVWGGRTARGLMLAGRAVAPALGWLAALWLALVAASMVAGSMPPVIGDFEVLAVGPWDVSWAAQWEGPARAAATALGWVAAAFVVGSIAWATWLPDSAAAWIGRRDVRRSFLDVARSCGLSERVHAGNETHWTDPRLLRVKSRGGVVIARVRARRGQSGAEVVAVAEKVAAGVGAAAYRASLVSPSVAELRLTMFDALARSTVADLPEPTDVGAMIEPVDVGRDESGMPWRLSLVGRHTLVAGRSGSGKGSVLWGAVASLAPWIAQDTVRIHGVDLKRGVEIAMGDGLMYRTAYRPEQALTVLRDLLTIIDERATHMVGQSRLHEPLPGDPLHVLVIDELAALTAYADVEVKKEGNRLLAEILTQGRAMGVVVVAFVQDPKKETVPARGLFTQTIALRLASADEVRMVLGQGMSDEAPAHRIPMNMPGAGYLVTEEGSVARVRADYWPDHLIKATAARFPAAQRWVPPLEETSTERAHFVQVTTTQPDEGSQSPRPRSPRKRSPRRPAHATEATNVIALEGMGHAPE